MHEVERAPVAVQYLARLKPGKSRENTAFRLKAICQILSPGVHPVDFPWHRLSPVEVGVLRGELERRYAPNSANAHLTALRGVLRCAWRDGLLTADQYEKLTDVRPIAGGTVRHGRCLSMGEVARLMAVAKERKGPMSRRDAAMVGVMLEAGLRKSEVSRLQLKDYVRGSLDVVRSKHGKTRQVPLDRSRQLLARWLDQRGLGEGALFSKQSGGHLSPDMVDQIVKGILRAAGLGDITLHDLRRTMISTMLARGNDLAVAARIAGHSSPRTTMVYDKRPQEAAEAAVRTLQMPL